MTGYYIGGLHVPGGAVLAPMAGITDPPTRELNMSLGAAASVSEMTIGDIKVWHSNKTRLRLGNVSGPHIVQIAGSDPVKMSEASIAAADVGADVVDINMGCPAKKVCRKAAGSALLRDEPLVGRILDAVVAACPVPVTLKMRTGWDLEHRNGLRVARMAEAAGIQALAVHGRTRACRFTGAVDLETIRDIVNAVKIPVLANGDIDSAKTAREVLDLTGAAAVMIGRATQGKPWLVGSINRALCENTTLSSPSLRSQRDMILRHLTSLHEYYGEQRGVRVARKHLNWYCLVLDTASELRSRLVRAESSSEQVHLVRELMDRIIDGESTFRSYRNQGLAESGTNKQEEIAAETKDSILQERTHRTAA